MRKGAATPLPMTGLPANRTLLPAIAAGFLIFSITLAAADILSFPSSRTDLSPEELKRVHDVVSPTGNFLKAEPYEAMQGGALTAIDKVNRDIFSKPSASLNQEQGQDFHLGNALFRKLWVSAPSSTQASDGLGPLFNARSCQSCHVRDGRGHPPEEAGAAAKSTVEGAKDAAGAVARIPNVRTVSGHEKCQVAPNGAPDCVAAANAICKTKGFDSGRSLDMTTAEICPPKVWMAGRSTGPECRIETFVSRAVCQ